MTQLLTRFQQQRNKFFIFLLLGSFLITQPVFATLNTYSADLEKDSSQYLSIADASQTGLDLTGDFTQELWIKIESSFANEEVRTLINKGDNGGSERGWRWDMYKATGANPIFQFYISSDGSSGTWKDSASYAFVTATWYHLRAQYDASAGTIDVFINGVQLGSTITGLPTSIFNNASALQIGRAVISGTGYYYFDGLIDDVRIYDAIVSDDYETELTGTETNLQAYWQMDNDFLDLTANNNDLTNNNTITFSADVPFEGTAPPAGGGGSTTSTITFETTDNLDYFISRYGQTMMYLMGGAVFAIFVYLIYNFYREYKKWFNNV